MSQSFSSKAFLKQSLIGPVRQEAPEPFPSKYENFGGNAQRISTPESIIVYDYPNRSLIVLLGRHAGALSTNNVLFLPV